MCSAGLLKQSLADPAQHLNEPSESPWSGKGEPAGQGLRAGAAIPVPPPALQGAAARRAACRSLPLGGPGPRWARSQRRRPPAAALRRLQRAAAQEAAKTLEEVDDAIARAEDANEALGTHNLVLEKVIAVREEFIGAIQYLQQVRALAVCGAGGPAAALTARRWLRRRVPPFWGQLPSSSAAPGQAVSACAAWRTEGQQRRACGSGGPSAEPPGLPAGGCCGALRGGGGAGAAAAGGARAHAHEPRRLCGPVAALVPRAVHALPRGGGGGLGRGGEQGDCAARGVLGGRSVRSAARGGAGLARDHGLHAAGAGASGGGGRSGPLRLASWQAGGQPQLGWLGRPVGGLWGCLQSAAGPPRPRPGPPCCADCRVPGGHADCAGQRARAVCRPPRRVGRFGGGQPAALAARGGEAAAQLPQSLGAAGRRQQAHAAWCGWRPPWAPALLANLGGPVPPPSDRPGPPAPARRRAWT